MFNLQNKFKFDMVTSPLLHHCIRSKHTNFVFYLNVSNFKATQCSNTTSDHKGATYHKTVNVSAAGVKPDFVPLHSRYACRLCMDPFIFAVILR